MVGLSRAADAAGLDPDVDLRPLPKRRVRTRLVNCSCVRHPVSVNRPTVRTMSRLNGRKPPSQALGGNMSYGMNVSSCCASRPHK